MNFLLMTVVVAFRVLSRHRMRSALTMLGIIIGVGAVIAMVSIGEGAKAAVQAQIASFGTNVITILPGSMTLGGVRTGHGGAVTLTIADMEELKKIPGVAYVGWSRRDAMQVVHENKNWLTTINAVSPDYLVIRAWTALNGEFFTQAEMDTAAKVALLGSTILKNLFEPGEDPMGATIRIKNMPFKVVGTLEAKGYDTRGNDQDDVVFIPFTTAERKIMGTKFLGSIAAGYLSAESPEQMAPVIDEVQRVLRQRHKLRPDQDDDFTVRNQIDIAKVQEGTSESMKLMLLAVASISLLVGGIGIMNILLVSVTERTREIGIRMAVGAKRRHILLQFLVEAVVLSAMGGLIGVGLGVAGAQAASNIAGWPTIISADILLIAFGFSALVGIFFGLYPANKASQLNPIEALRYE
ncbi:MAG: FtsX-like permease family protein [Nitrospirae bacterium]|nr:MAG: FtsX-like permease family protein [Nitrospirota bacterium]